MDTWTSANRFERSRPQRSSKRRWDGQSAAIDVVMSGGDARETLPLKEITGVNSWPEGVDSDTQQQILNSRKRPPVQGPLFLEDPPRISEP
jgi:hypothetical protein